jgi:hypothetical protein
MKKGTKGIGGKSNPNNMGVFNYTPTSLGKSSGHVNANPAYTKVSSGKSSGHVNKPVTVAKRKIGGSMKRGC